MSQLEWQSTAPKGNGTQLGHRYVPNRVVPTQGDHAGKFRGGGLARDPGMYGGFSIQLTGQELLTESFSRVVEGSGEKDRIRPDGPLLVSEGHV